MGQKYLIYLKRKKYYDKIKVCHELVTLVYCTALHDELVFIVDVIYNDLAHGCLTLSDIAIFFVAKQYSLCKTP
jgi:hypothetical protein